jgi:hypothetical protein
MRRVIATIGALLLAWLICTVVVGVLGSSNIFWGEANQYGHVDVPGRRTLHLPSGKVEASAALYVVGKGNETVDVAIPEGLALTITPPVRLERSLGSSGNSLTGGVNSQRRVWWLHVPRAGDYRIQTRGSLRGLGANAQIWFGHEPPIPGRLVPLAGLILLAIAAPIWFFVIAPRRARRRATVG